MLEHIIGGYLLFGFVLFWFTFVCYVVTMKAKAKREKIEALPKPLFYPVVVIIAIFAIPGYIGDLLWRILYATPIWLLLGAPWRHALPLVDTSLSWGRILNNLTLTHLLRKTLDGRAGIEPGTPPHDFSTWLCKYFLEPHDCGHCGSGFNK